MAEDTLSFSVRPDLPAEDKAALIEAVKSIKGVWNVIASGKPDHFDVKMDLSRNHTEMGCEISRLEGIESTVITPKIWHELHERNAAP